MGLKRWIAAIGALLIAAVSVLLFALPLPKSLSRAGTVECIWADGASTERYAEAYALLNGINADGSIALVRGDSAGRVETGEEFSVALAAFRTGNLSDLLTLDLNGLASLEYAAIVREYGETVFYAGGAFRLQGGKVLPDSPAYAREVVLLEGALPAHYLKDTGARRLDVRAAAELDADDVIASRIETVACEAPYLVQGNAVYRDTAGGRRLVTALPNCTSLVLSESDFVDRGALLACARLERLELSLGEYALGWYFQTANAYTMPEVLTNVTVSGGHVGEHCFYGFTLAEVDLCRVEAENIAREAFLGANISRIHTPRADVALAGGYSVSEAPCGCMVYEKR